MPMPAIPWIAIDFEEIVTKVAFQVKNSEPPVELSFSSVFYYDEEKQSPEICNNLDVLSKKDLTHLILLDIQNIKRGARIHVPNSDVILDVNQLLVLLLKHIRTECETKYFLNSPITTCIFLLRKQNELFVTLETAASLAGFSETLYRNKAICSTVAWLPTVSVNTQRIIV